MKTKSHLSREQIERRVQQLGDWFQNIDLKGVPTAPHHFLGDYPTVKWQRFANSIPNDLHGKSVLDIGCNAGFYCFELKRRGAARVVGRESEEVYLAQARFAAEVLGEDVEFRLGVYDIAQMAEKFDIVLFMGVIYHLRHPLLALDLIREHVAADMLIFQSMLRGCAAPADIQNDYEFRNTQVFELPEFPRMYFVENNYAGDPTNWWIPNRGCAEAMLRSSGFRIIDHPEEEVFICACH